MTTTDPLTPIDAVTKLDNDIDNLRVRAHPETYSSVIAGVVGKFTTKFEAEGLSATVNVAPAAVVAQYEERIRGQYDDELRRSAATIEADLETTGRALAETIAMVGQLPNPQAAASASVGGEMAHELRQTRLLLELDRAERQLSGKTPAQVCRLYEAAPDSTVAWVIESQQRAGWPDVTLSTEQDALGVRALQEAIKKTQRARVERDHPALVAAETKLQALRRSATTDTLLRHLKSGRGLALIR